MLGFAAISHRLGDGSTYQIYVAINSVEFYGIGEFILQLMDSMMASKKLPDFMSFLVSLIKSSSAYLKDDALLGIV